MATSSSFVSSLLSAYYEEYQDILELQVRAPMFTSRRYMEQELFPVIWISVGIITFVFLSALWILFSFVYNNKNITTTDTTNNSTAPRPIHLPYKAAYQVTNLLVNFVLGIMGYYYYAFTLSNHPTMEQQVIGYDISILREANDHSPQGQQQFHDTMYYVGCAQLGYNLWAIPVGLFLVQESSTMIGHHVSVILVTIMSNFFTLGYRHYGPFMFGLLETSSVPLAIMNFFKDHPEYIQRYPQSYTTIRLVFAGTFLFVRWYLYLPLKYDFLRLYGMGIVVYYELHEYGFMIYGIVVWIASFFLLMLQLLWGTLIVKSLLKLVIPQSSKSKTKSLKDNRSTANDATDPTDMTETRAADYVTPSNKKES